MDRVCVCMAVTWACEQSNFECVNHELIAWRMMSHGVRHEDMRV